MRNRDHHAIAELRDATAAWHRTQQAIAHTYVRICDALAAQRDEQQQIEREMYRGALVPDSDEVGTSSDDNNSRAPADADPGSATSCSNDPARTYPRRMP